MAVALLLTGICDSPPSLTKRGPAPVSRSLSNGDSPSVHGDACDDECSAVHVKGSAQHAHVHQTAATKQEACPRENENNGAQAGHPGNGQAAAFDLQGLDPRLALVTQATPSTVMSRDHSLGLRAEGDAEIGGRPGGSNWLEAERTCAVEEGGGPASFPRQHTRDCDEGTGLGSECEGGASLARGHDGGMGLEREAGAGFERKVWSGLRDGSAVGSCGQESSGRGKSASGGVVEDQQWVLLLVMGSKVSKDDVRRGLGVVSSSCPAACPSRGMLKQVFNFFQDGCRL